MAFFNFFQADKATLRGPKVWLDVMVNDQSSDGIEPTQRVLVANMMITDYHATSQYIRF